MANTNGKPADKGTAATSVATPPTHYGVEMPYDPAETHGPAHKYGEQAKYLSCADVRFTMTATGALFAASGCGKSGKPTVDALTLVAAKRAGATATHAVTGLQIAQAMLEPDIAERLAATKAVKYCPGTRLPAPAWVNGYINGRARDGWLRKVA